MRILKHIERCIAMESVRLNITLPKDLARQLESVVGARMRSKFIADAVAERIEALRKEALRAEMTEGYERRKEEGLALTREFEAADLEGWDDY